MLVPGGILAVGIWSSLEKQGIQRPYAEAIERVTGVASMNAPYGTVTEETLRDLLADVGFDRISIEEVTIAARFRRSFHLCRSYGGKHLRRSSHHAWPQR